MGPTLKSSAEVLGANDRDLDKGDVVGEYVVEAKIGEGGFGSVFLAEHPVIGKRVAIKVLRRRYSAEPEYVSRFIAEARSVNQIRHRNIIDIFAFGNLPDGRHYFVMEYLEGHTLEEHRHARGRLPVGEAIALLRPIAKALDAAHRKGVAHRDLKPDNIFLVEEEGQPVFPKLLDFGIAKLLSDEEERGTGWTRTGAPLGTPVYMSPEQARGREIDHRTDIYSFGVMLYELVTGRLPFVGDDYFEVLSAHVSKAPELPSSRCKDVPEAIDAPILRMLEKKPDKRPHSVSLGLKGVERAAQAAGIDVPAGPPTSAVFAVGTGSVGEDVGVASTKAAFDGALPTEPEITSPGVQADSRSRSLPWPWLGAAAAVALVGALVWLSSGSQDSVDRQRPAPRAVRAAAPAAAIDAGRADAAGASTPEIVDVDIVGAPDGAAVYGPSGKYFGAAPGRIQVLRSEQPLVLQIRAPGYRPTSREIVPASDLQLRITLDKDSADGGQQTRPPRPPPPPPPKPPENTRGSLEDPFD